MIATSELFCYFQKHETENSILDENGVNKILLFAIFSLLSFTASARVLSGHELKEWMPKYEAAVAGQPAGEEAGLFMGYIRGVLTTAVSAGAVCPPNTSFRQTGNIVAKYVQTHPSQLDQPARTVVLAALKDAYPCTQPK